ncbi:TrbG/VirB9 family P-type conjugative transfer protein [Burkholderia sp. Ac-20365]|uniref:TrbG/VirB9 family P-type conjugative transfer protein n=1 Tax=Burkholderia sp. Ac-20365 TaxID=2703897 RepID=UPI00197CAAF0|nr:TrbG/VirB9 family P-type conjugative transfer protein [Burkholderia sp. Ac-20365]
MPLPTDNRIVTFTYSSDAVYTLLAMQGAATHIELGADEGITEKPGIGDSIQWRVSGGPKNLYIKPVRPGLMTTMTLVTNKRTYEFELRSSPVGGKFYQKVGFVYPDEEQALQLRAQSQAQAFIAEKTRLNDQLISPSGDPSTYHYGYTITGDAPFRPLEVLDNGSKTFIHLPHIQDQPAVFLKDGNGKLQLVDNHMRGEDFVVVDRLADALVLKLNDQEVTITSDRAPKHWWQRSASTDYTH